MQPRSESCEVRSQSMSSARSLHSVSISQEEDNESTERRKEPSPSPELSIHLEEPGEQSGIIQTVVHFLTTHTAYDALPASGKVSVFNANMPICLAFECLRSQGILRLSR
ncbi:hypothetical protein WA171_005680 [Blastocystis sp. BT1]